MKLVLIVNFRNSRKSSGFIPIYPHWKEPSQSIMLMLISFLVGTIFFI